MPRTWPFAAAISAIFTLWLAIAPPSARAEDQSPAEPVFRLNREQFGDAVRFSVLGNHVFLHAARGLLHSADLGRTWQPFSQEGLAPYAVIAETPAGWILPTLNGVYVARAKALPWSKLSKAPVAGAVWLATSNRLWIEGKGKLLGTRDGIKWQQSPKLPDFSLTRLLEPWPGVVVLQGVKEADKKLFVLDKKAWREIAVPEECSDVVLGIQGARMVCDASVYSLGSDHPLEQLEKVGPAMTRSLSADSAASATALILRGDDADYVYAGGATVVQLPQRVSSSAKAVALPNGDVLVESDGAVFRYPTGSLRPAF